METRKRILLILIFAVLFLGNTGHFILPQVFTSYKVRSYSSDTKANLHNIYLACKAHWADHGPDQSCNREIASATTYGYVQSQEVKIYGSGTENDFCAFAWHLGNREIFTMNSFGTISRQAKAFSKYTFNTNPPDKIWIYEKFLPRHLVYYSIILLLPIATMILTAWAEGYYILRRKRKTPSLNHIGAIVGSATGVIIGWVIIVAIDWYVVILFLLMILILIILTAWLILRRKRKPPSLFQIGINTGIVFGWLFIALITSGFAGDDYTYSVGFGKPFGVFFGIPVVFSISRASSLIRWGKQIERAKDIPDYLENQNAKKLKKSGTYLLGVIGVLLVLPYIYSERVSKYKENYYNQSVKFSEEIESSIQTNPSSFQKMCSSGSFQN